LLQLRRRARRKNLGTKVLYVQVLIAILLGAIVGWLVAGFRDQ
jgi:hypothetical protein